MEIMFREVNNVVIFDISGEIDLYNAPRLKNAILQNIDNKKYNIIINFLKVNYIDSSGIGSLISSLSNLKKNQGTLKIINISPAVKKVFELTRLNNFFEIFDTEKEAIVSYV